MGAQQEPLNGPAREFVPSALQKSSNGSAKPSHTVQNGRKQASTGVRLPQELEQELTRITNAFTVDTAKLRDIVDHFGRELEDGLNKTHQNIVR